MSSIIQTVSYTKEAAKDVTEKFGELIGVHRVELAIREGQKIEGIISEVGKDYIIIIEGSQDVIIPTEKILFCRYDR